MNKTTIAVFVLFVSWCFAGDRFAEKVVLVTGGSSGIGYATALKFAQEGAKVVFCARDSNPAWFNGSSAEKRINSDPIVVESGGYARFVKADVTNTSEMRDLFENILKNEKTLDIAVNNAGIVGAIGIEATAKYIGGEHDALYNNLYGTVNSVLFEMELWTQQDRGGIIVNVASVNGYKGSAGAPLYPTSKHGIIGLTKSIGLAGIKGPHVIRCNAIAPGFTDTPLVWNQVKFIDDGKTQTWEGDYITHDHPLWKKHGSRLVNADGKIIPPEDQASMILYLASDEASSINGATLLVDGCNMA